MGAPTPQMISRVLAAMPPTGEALTSRAIYARIGCWAPSSVRDSLGALVRMGRVQRLGPSDQRRRYALVIHREQAA